MKSADVRKAFLEYFRSREHTLVKSSSLIPQNDPTLLFTNAGMVQFKSVFLGEEKRSYQRAATCQKSMRAGGKHSDLENVGHTKRHHTFFEMLGNFSFGDYFKREAIVFAWELLTVQFKLPINKLWVTIYENDDEAERLWQEAVGVPADRIVRLGAKDNFWQMADTGPCGPCSEIHIDQGAEAGCGKPGCKIGCDCDRFLELWNLVFMQFNRNAKGELEPLPRPSIDTGMGLERISSVLQGKLNNFDTDLFSDIIGSISSHTGVAYGKSRETDVSLRVIADHSRAAAFLISDGLMPSNEGRGYVLRRIIRRAARHARLLGRSEPLLCHTIEAVAATMGPVYPELKAELDRASKVLRVEEERFDRTLEQGMKRLDDLLGQLRSTNTLLIPGGEVFKLYDTFGFPVDLVRDIAHDSGLHLDEKGFTEAMESQREKARASWVGQDEAIASIYREVLTEAGPTEFLGYEHMESESVIKAILMNGQITEEVSEAQEAELILDRTPFYGESGGQVGDTGYIQGADGSMAEVAETKRPLEGLFCHRVKMTQGRLRVWDKVHCRLDTERRADIMRNHTATHLLQAALRGVLGDHVKQAGSLVAPERLRFDFTHFTGLTQEELREVEDAVNARVLENHAVYSREMEIQQALETGATALFGEKYGEHVRVVGVADVSRELCGGTHCKGTGEIGPFLIESEGSVASGIRRIEAVTGRPAHEKIRGLRTQMKALGALVKSEAPMERVAALMDEMKQLQREREKLQAGALKDASAEIIAGAREVGGVKVIAHRMDGLDAKALRTLADQVRDRLGSGVLVLASAHEGQAAILSMVTPDLVKKHSAGAILKVVAEAAGGRGGGKPDMAQGGTKEIEKLDEALKKVYDIVKGA